MLGSRYNLTRLVLSLLAATLLHALTVGQATASSATDIKTPPALAPGAPSGSYALSGFDNINLYNGNLNFRLPLLQVGGRGGASYTMTLALEQKWTVDHTFADQGQHWPVHAWWTFRRPGYGPGVLHGRQMNEGCPEGIGYPIWTMTTLTFTAPDGTEYELRDEQTGGNRLQSQCFNSYGVGASRGTVFKTYDGSAATFVSDSVINDWTGNVESGPHVIEPTGYLMLRDGTRYRIEWGKVMWMRDRNGNKLTFQYNSPYGVTLITDSLGRQITVEYDVSDPQYGLCDRITFAGFGGAQRRIWVTKTTLGNALRSGYSLQTYAQLFPYLTGSSSTYHNPAGVVSAVVIPDGRSYQFRYNSHSELARVVLPAGGAFEYDWVEGGAGAICTSGPEIRRRVAERRVYRDGSALELRQLIGWGIDSYDAGGTLVARSRSYFHGGMCPGEPLLSHSQWNEGKEYRTEEYAADGATVLRKTERTWQQTTPSWYWNVWTAEPANDPKLVTTISTIEPNGANLIAKQTAINPSTGALGFDQYINPTDLWEYDYGAGAPGALLRRTHTDYVTATAYTAHTGAHLRSLVSARQVYGYVGGVETLAAKSETLYDQGGLTAYAAVTGWADPGTSARGNATTQRAWLDTSNTWIETHAAYDQLGNVVSTTDGRDNSATVSYQDAFSDGISRNTYALPTGVTSAVPAPSPGPFAGRGSSTPLVTSATYDYSTGSVKTATDANGQSMSYEYNDPLDRLKRVDRPDGGYTAYTYVDQHQCGPYVQTRALLDSSGRETVAYQFFDGLGRGVRSFNYDPQDASNPYQTSDTQYDALGRAWRVSADSYRSAGCTSAVNPSNRWVETTFDALGRPTHVKTTADGAQVTTAYSGNTVTVTDQAGKQRRSVSDALGRLTQVVETPGAGSCQSDGVGCATNYLYDAMGNLRRVEQGTQYRYFMYDSLGRLIRAKKPEQTGAIPTDADFPVMTDPVTGNAQWTLGYSYDENGNLWKRRDSRNVTTTHTYDNLNRAIRTDYTDGTPMTLFTYDFATNGRGRFYANYESSTTGMINFVHAYDAAGRPTSGSANFYLLGTGWLPGYNYSRVYDKAGNVTSQTYPSGRSVSYNYDAAGRLADNGANVAFSGNLGDSAQRTYSSGVNYDEAGRMRQERFGTQTPLYHKLHYNVRGQLFDVRLSTVMWQPNGAGEWDWNRGCVALYYGGAPHQQSGPSNNGNVTMAQHWVPANDQMSAYNLTQQTYAYDELNRLASVTEQAWTQAGTGGPHAAQHFTYDRWGNRTINTSQTWGAGVNNRAFSVDAASNRLGVPGGQPGVMQYDNAGNLANDTYTGTGARAYDAENRMTSAWGPGLYGGAYQNGYVYDAAGKRVRRRVESGEVWHVYGFDGELLAEYGAAASAAVPRKEYGYRGGELLVAADGVSSGPSSDVVWVEDSLPAGAQTGAGGWNEAWNWVGSSPAPASGAVSNQSPVTAGLHQQYFEAVTQTLPIVAGDNLVAYVYLDPANTPSQIMLQFKAPVGGWEHRAYWGANQIGWGADGTQSRRHMGTLPPAGQWVRLEVPAEAVGLVGQSLTGLALTLYNGRATWDRMGKAAAAGPHWLVSDHLGTPRMTADQTGSLANIRRHDYLPFGEDIGAGVGGRTTGQGYSQPDGVTQKFTGKERDSETSLDYLGVRYYSSASGRFAGVDPRSGEVDRPQSWNAYAYAVNNPVNRFDPDGAKDVPAFMRRFVFTSIRAILQTSLRLNVSAGGLFAISGYETGYGRSNAFRNHNNVSGASVKEVPLKYESLERGYQAWGEMLKKNFSDTLGIVDPYKFLNAIQDDNGYKYNSANPNYLSTITGILSGFGFDFFDTCVMTPIFSGHGVTFGGVTVTDADALNKLLTSTQPWDQQAATRFIMGVYDGWENYVRNIGTENDASVQSIRSRHSLVGSDPVAEEESLYEYRVARGIRR